MITEIEIGHETSIKKDGVVYIRISRLIEFIDRVDRGHHSNASAITLQSIMISSL